MMATFSVTENTNRNSPSPTMATAGQLLTTGGTATITVVANASGQTLLVQPTTIVNTSPPRHTILKQVSEITNDQPSPKLDADDVITETSEDRVIERGARTIVENTHYITVPEGTAAARSYTSLTPVTPSIVPETETVGTNGVSHSTYVQYVDGTTDQTIYTTNGQMAYPVYTVNDTGTTMYSPTSGQYYQTNSGSPVAYSQVIRVANNINQGNNQSQIINNGPYLIQQNVDSDHTIITATTARNTSTSDVSYLVNSTSTNNTTNNVVVSAPSTSNETVANNNNLQHSADTASNINHIPKVSPATVQWLLDNYETADGVSLPRSTLYYYYMHHCSESKIDPVNAASFGKLIRSVFVGLRTRRLGTRGNSKYHYYGIRLKPDSPLNNLSVNEENGTFTNRTTNGNTCQTQKRFRSSKPETNDTQYNTEQNHSTSSYQSVSSPESQHNQFLGDGASAIPDFPEITFNNGTLPEDCSLDDVDTFRSIYREHCEMFLHAIENLEFSTIKSLWREFWRCQDSLDDCEEERYLSKTKLYQLSKCLEVQDFVRYVDYRFYQNLVTVLVPDVLRSIPSSLTQSIRNFAKSLETWLSSAMVDCPREMTVIKSNTVSAFSQTLRRYTSLNHLAQAARAVLQNSAQINQMLTDLNRVDFHNVQEQASWVSQCDTNLVRRLEEDFKITLQQQNSLEEWANWLKNVVDEVLKPHVGKKSYIKAARQFLLKWSFYSSMVIRDLTLRSASSFGSFHLIRLLYDEYMFYVIEHLVAKATGETPMAVMGEKYLTATPEYVNFDVTINDTSDCNDGSITIEALDSDSSNLLLASNDIMEIGSPKRMKL
ncbi:DNA-binding protein RFX2-like isoform X2 [Planococcus citri]|uniref:DNA-binding protein RFX2-like isoform X2 n=1 Tax=Planococcus citri TaxID=170843 RepID=UPI0031F94457